MTPNVNREAIAQAAMAFIHMNNLAVQARDERSEDYALAMVDATEHMQREFLRWIGNASHDWAAISQVDGRQAIAFAAVIYTCVTGLDIEVKG